MDWTNLFYSSVNVSENIAKNGGGFYMIEAINNPYLEGMYNYVKNFSVVFNKAYD